MKELVSERGFKCSPYPSIMSLFCIPQISGSQPVT